MDQDVEDTVTEPGANRTSGTGKLTTSASTSDSRLNSAQRMVGSWSVGPERKGHGDMEVDAELEWPEDMEIPDSAVPIADNSRRSSSLSQPQNDSQPPGNSNLSAPRSRATASPAYILSQTRLRTRSFRSGSLQVIPGPKISRQGSTSQSKGNDRSASGNAIVESQSQQLESQESQGSTSESGSGYKHSYIQLQTQAPYQSQSYSQNLSETSTG